MSAWSNGGYSDNPSNPDYGTHDWIAEHTLDWLPTNEKEYIIANLATYLYGTELPDNPNPEDGIGDTAKHHIYYASTLVLIDDSAAVRAQEKYVEALGYLNANNFAMAAKTVGSMSHYIVDMAVFGHVMGSGTDWGDEVHHSDYESYVNTRTNSYYDDFNIYLSFDGKLNNVSAYNAALLLAYDTTFDVDGDLTCLWMDNNYDWNNPTFKDRCGESLNLAVNCLTDVLHTLYVETGQESNIPESLTTYLRTLSTGWNQETVNEANLILSNTTYSSGDWEVFFSKYFSNNPFTDNLRNYLGYPVFWWFSDEVHANLQRGLINPLTNNIEHIMSDHHENLSVVLTDDPEILQTFMNSHRFLNDMAKVGIVGDDAKSRIYDFYVNLVNNYPLLLKKNVTFNPETQPYLAAVRAQVWMNLRDMKYLNQSVKEEIAATIGLTGRYLDVWNKFSVLVIDNNGFDSRQLNVIYDLLTKIPKTLHELGSITCHELLGNTGDRYLWFNTKMSVNIFNIEVGATPENGFPSDVDPMYSDIFTLVLVHEVNHAVDVYLQKIDESFDARRVNLIARAGNDRINYLRSMFEDGFFVKYPQEFFASISNQWFSNTSQILELALTRFSHGYLEPINQFLFFADAYSLGSNETIFYTLDVEGNIESRLVLVKRDLQGHITSLLLNRTLYHFTLDNEGNVLNVDIYQLTSPTSSFTYFPTTNLSIIVTINFEDTSTDSDGNIVTWLWDFGDNDTSNDQNPTHKYGDKGTYTVKLTVTDNDGLTDIKTQQISILNLSPRAEFTYSPKNPMVNQDVNFTDQSEDPEGKMLSYSWEFDDGSTSTERNPSHKYETAGAYTVKLTVTDDEGAKATGSITITVTKIPTIITCSISSSEVTEGDSITVSGIISPAVSEKTVTLTYQKPDGSTHNRTVTTGSDGSYSDTYQLDAAGSWSVTASWTGDPIHEGASSSPEPFTVKAKFALTTEEAIAIIGVIVTIAVIILIVLKRRKIFGQ